MTQQSTEEIGLLSIHWVEKSPDHAEAWICDVWWVLELSDRFEIWQECCEGTCQISERYHFYNQSDALKLHEICQ